jgi:prepilin-type N-terminal cleavage/methylation domain-containing protein
MRGFSILELSIVILIIGIIATGVLPRIVGKTPSYKKFLNNINYITQKGIINSIEKSESSIILVDLNTNSIYLQTIKKENISKIDYDNKIDIIDFLINGKSQFSIDSKKLQFWFYINKDGIVQNVNIIIKDNNLNKSLNLEVNPFSGIFYIK